MLFVFVFFLCAAAARATTLIPGPPGPYPVGLKVTSLTDESRLDPLAPPSSPQKRRLMASVFVPIEDEDSECLMQLFPYMPPASAVAYGQVMGSLGLPNVTFEGFELEFCDLDSANLYSNEDYPVIIFSHGSGASRLLQTVQARALASHGYVVITVDHTFDSAFVEFTDGTTETRGNFSELDPDSVAMRTDVRAADVSFIIDQLQDSSNSDSLAGIIPIGVDTDKILVYGHSLGGATAATAILTDDRISGGLNFDGALWGTVKETGVDKPFVLFGMPRGENDTVEWGDFYDLLQDSKMHAVVEGTQHLSFTDISYIFWLRGIPPELLPAFQQMIGTIDGEQLEKIINDVVLRLAQFLFDGDSAGLRAIDDDFPEVVIKAEDLP